jgi:transposase
LERELQRGPKGFGSRDFRDLLVRARIQLGGPIVLVRANVRIHLTTDLREFFAANTDWLTVFQLPAYAPDLNPREGVWSLVQNDLGNLAAADLGQITRTVKRKLKALQYRPSCSTAASPAPAPAPAWPSTRGPAWEPAARTRVQ